MLTSREDSGKKKFKATRRGCETLRCDWSGYAGESGGHNDRLGGTSRESGRTLLFLCMGWEPRRDSKWKRDVTWLSFQQDHAGSPGSLVAVFRTDRWGSIVKTGMSVMRLLR